VPKEYEGKFKGYCQEIMMSIRNHQKAGTAVLSMFAQS
jgi:hypothetical protein